MNAPEYLIIGRVLKPWSYRGELKIEVITGYPNRFASLQKVFIGEDAKPFSVERARMHGKFALMKLVGVDTDQAAASLRDQLIYVAREEAVQLPKGKHFLHELIGLRVVTTEGVTLGTVEEILDTRANDVYVVRDGAREILIPAAEEIVKEIAPERGEIVVKLIEGIL
jgi:16S rRNA processing protein RimM